MEHLKELHYLLLKTYSNPLDGNRGQIGTRKLFYIKLKVIKTRLK